MLFGKKSKSAQEATRVANRAAQPSPRALRKQTYANCTVKWDRGGEMMGTVLDVSNSGILVRLKEGARIPKQVRLSCPTYGVAGPAELVRSDGPDFAFSLVR